MFLSTQLLALAALPLWAQGLVNPTTASALGSLAVVAVFGLRFVAARKKRAVKGDPLEKATMVAGHRPHNGNLVEGRDNVLGELDLRLCETRAQGESLAVLLFEIEDVARYPRDTIEEAFTRLASRGEMLGRSTESVYVIGISSASKQEARSALRNVCQGLKGAMPGIQFQAGLEHSLGSHRRALKLYRKARGDMSEFTGASQYTTTGTMAATTSLFTQAMDTLRSMESDQ
jgi:hypothetical protein